MFDIASHLQPTPTLNIPSPAEIYQKGLELRGLGQQNRQRELTLGFEPQRLQNEQDLQAKQLANAGQQNLINQNTINQFPTANAAQTSKLAGDKTDREAKVLELLRGLTATTSYLAQSDPDNSDAHLETLKKQINAIAENNKDLNPDLFDVSNFDSAHFKDPIFLKRTSRLLMGQKQREDLERTEDAREIWSGKEGKPGLSAQFLQATRTPSKGWSHASHAMAADKVQELINKAPMLVELPEVKEAIQNFNAKKSEPQARPIVINPNTRQNQSFQQENTLRDEVNKKIIPFETGLTAYQKLDEAVRNGNSADAYAAVIDYVKTLDPGSTVREGEYASAKLAAAGGAWGKFQQWAENIRSGQMTPQAKKNILESARGLITAEKKGYDRIKKDYKDRVKSYRDRGFDINEAAVLPNYPELEAELNFKDSEGASETQYPTPKSDSEFSKIPVGGKFWHDGVLQTKTK